MVSKRQSYVLENIERVIDRPYKLRVRNPRPRYSLDGLDCTFEVTGLVVGKLIALGVDRRLERAS